MVQGLNALSGLPLMLITSLDNAVAFYINLGNNGSDEGNLRQFYISIRDTVFERPAKFFSSLLLPEGVGIGCLLGHNYSWEIYDTEKGIALVELEGALGDRDPVSNKLFPERSSPGSLEKLTLLIYPPLEALEHKIRNLLFRYDISFKEQRQTHTPYSAPVGLLTKTQ
jgi:hypothetical protein